MKYISRAVFFICILLCAVLLSSCSDNKDLEPIPEEISYVKAEESVTEKWKDTAASYLAAVKKHDHTAVTMFTTSDFEMNYNETGFYEYCNGITDFSIKEIDFDHVTENGGNYYIPVTYTLTYSSPFTDEEGSDQEPGKYTYYVYIVMVQEDDTYRICDITDRPMG